MLLRIRKILMSLCSIVLHKIDSCFRKKAAQNSAKTVNVGKDSGGLTLCL